MPPAVELLILDPQIRKMHPFVDVWQLVFECPCLDLSRVAVRMAVVVVAVAIALTQPLLVLALQLVVQDDALDVRVARVSRRSATLR